MPTDPQNEHSGTDERDHQDQEGIAQGDGLTEGRGHVIRVDAGSPSPADAPARVIETMPNANRAKDSKTPRMSVRTLSARPQRPEAMMSSVAASSGPLGAESPAAIKHIGRERPTRAR